MKLFGKKPEAAPQQQDIIAVLRDLVAPEMVQSVHVGDGTSDKGWQVIVTLAVDPLRAGEFESARFEAEQAIARVKSVSKATVILTAERAAPEMPSVRGGTKPKSAPLVINNVRHIIAVASGKGGVGKSTVAANLAVSLSKLGLKVGLLDADIYGPSVPRMMGIPADKPQQDSEGRINPPEAHGLKVMSMGFMVAEETPMIWRGPMVQSAIQQLLRDVNWAPLDVLVIDMPPGTGDAQLTLAQKVPLSGAVIVSTPQDIALLDARKGINMFRATSVPILGIVENMSYFCCPNCGERSEIFGHGGARAEAEKLGVPFLGEIPLHAEIRTLSDDGVPVSLKGEQHHMDAFDGIAGAVQALLESGVAAKQPPKIIIED